VKKFPGDRLAADNNFLLRVSFGARPGKDDLLGAVAVVTVDVQNPSVESGFGWGKGHARLALGVGSQAGAAGIGLRVVSDGGKAGKSYGGGSGVGKGDGLRRAGSPDLLIGELQDGRGEFNGGSGPDQSYGMWATGRAVVDNKIGMLLAIVAVILRSGSKGDMPVALLARRYAAFA
jgi:hypothetical protein